MIYMGSKARIAQNIFNVILSYIAKDNKFSFCTDLASYTLYDCFCGGGNFAQYSPFKKTIASDINKYTIAYLNKIKDDISWLPKNNSEFTEDKYNYVRQHKDEFPDWYVGHVGYNLSFGGKFFGGWRRDNAKKDYVKFV